MTITIRPMSGTDLDRLGDIDRSEQVSTAYRQEGREVHERSVDWSIPRWRDDAEGEFHLGHRIDVLRQRVARGELPFGAFVGERLVGYIVLRERLAGTTAQLAELFVDREHRRTGVATELFATLVSRARQSGHDELYVSAIPVRSAVAFYQSLGFRPTADPDPELLRLEPDDIHMRVRI